MTVKRADVNVNRLIFLAVFCVGLTGCSSTEKTEKIEETTLDYLETSYHITDAEVLSIEPTEQYGSIFVVLFERIFAGRTYDVHVKVQDATSTTINGQVNARELVFRNDDYVPAKHEKLIKESETYRNLLKSLEDEGILVEKIEEGIDYELYHQDIRLLNYVLNVNETAFDAKIVVEHLQNLSTHMLENIDTTIEITLQIPLRFYEFDKFTENIVEIKLTHANEKKFIEKLNQQMLHAHLITQVDDNLKKEIKTFHMDVSSSRLVEQVQSNRDSFFQHEITLDALKGFEENDLLTVINLLREKGFDETDVGVYFANGYTDKCKVKQVKILADIARCYDQVYGF